MPENTPVIQPPALPPVDDPQGDDHMGAYLTTPDATLWDICDRLPPTVVFADDTPIGEIIEHFNNYPTHAGVVIDCRKSGRLLISREQLFQSLAQSFALEVFNKRQAHEYLKINGHRHTSLRLPADTPVAEAISHALARDEALRYEPLLIDHALKGQVLADIRLLIDYQRTQLAETLSIVEDHHQLAEHNADHDLLTGLANRLALLRKLDEAVATPNPQRPVTALLLMDFTHFKLVNASLGHDVGDVLLIQIAERLEDAVRRFRRRVPGTMVCIARQGGDEFGILIAHLEDDGQARELAWDIIDVMQRPFDLHQREVYSTPVIGMSSTAISGPDPTHVLRDADTAMAAALRSINTPCVVFEPRLREQAVERIRLETDLRDAIARDELHAAYQPIFHAESGKIVGFEALCRWDHPELGAIPAPRFIPIAEQAGLIGAVGQAILDQAIRQTADCRQRFPDQDLFVSVNIALRQLLSPDFVDQVLGLLNTHRLPANALVLELSESTLVEHRSDTDATVQRLQDAGIRLAMDSFGGSNAALTQLHTLPLHVVKIDRQLVAQLDGSSPYAAVVDALVNVAKRLGMTVAMKCIESPAQIVQAQTIGCDLLQGYHLAEPTSPEGIATAIENADLHPALR
ncbi:MAG: bifunctional diguanylate cyclase/phosphodiesterase [Planctomycetota bacterium]